MLGFDEHGEMGEDLQGESRTINDVLLPPWAKNATDFIQLNAKVSSIYYYDTAIFTCCLWPPIAQLVERRTVVVVWYP